MIHLGEIPILKLGCLVSFITLLLTTYGNGNHYNSTGCTKVINPGDLLLRIATKNDIKLKILDLE
jgi:hypothetical protein